MGVLAVLAAAVACSRDREAVAPNEPLTPASGVDTRATPADSDDETEWPPGHVIPPPGDTRSAPDPEAPDTIIPPDEAPDPNVPPPPMPDVPPAELPPSSGPDGGTFNWIDDTGNTVE